MPTELLKLNLSGLTAWHGRTAAMLARLQNLAPVFELGDTAFRLEMAQQFETQGSYLQGGVEWTPLSPEYAKRKPTPPAPFGILYLTGDLYRSLSQPGGAHVKEIHPDRATYGSTVSYGKYHQTGAAGPGNRRLPQRKIIIVRDRLRVFMQRATIAYVVSGRLKTGAGE